MNVAKGDFDFCGTCDLNELRAAEMPQRTPACVLPTQVGPHRATDPCEDFNSPGNGTLLGAARQDDQRISKSRFDTTDIVRVAAFDRTLLQLDFGSIASSAEALGPAAASRAQRSTARAVSFSGPSRLSGRLIEITAIDG